MLFFADWIDVREPLVRSTGRRRDLIDPCSLQELARARTFDMELRRGADLSLIPLPVLLRSQWNG